MFVEAEDGNVAVTFGEAVVSGNGRKAIDEVFDPRVGGDDVVLAHLAEELVVLVTAREGDDDVATQFVIEAELRRVGENAGGAGVGGLRDDLLGIEVNIEQAGGPPWISRSSSARSARSSCQEAGSDCRGPSFGKTDIVHGLDIHDRIRCAAGKGRIRIAGDARRWR